MADRDEAVVSRREVYVGMVGLLQCDRATVLGGQSTTRSAVLGRGAGERDVHDDLRTLRKCVSRRRIAATEQAVFQSSRAHHS